MAKGGGTKGGIWKCPFQSLKNPWKCPDFSESRNFQAFFMAPLPRKTHEKCLKNAWKMHEKPLIQKSGYFQIPPFMPPPFAILRLIVKKQTARSGKFRKHFKIWDRKGAPKNLCDNDFAELSSELSGAICLKTLVLVGQCPRIVQMNALVLFVRFVGFGVLFLALEFSQCLASWVWVES